MVMRSSPGETLRGRLAANECPLPLEDLLEIAIQVCDGLQAAQERGIVHRDIKPANIFITDKGVCKILDFGLAKLLEASNKDEVSAQPDTPTVALPDASGASHLTRTGVALGTAGYMSPEQVRGEKLDARTDLFSFGLVLYMALILSIPLSQFSILSTRRALKCSASRRPLCLAANRAFTIFAISK